jgi:hypothetical protein
MKELLNYYDLRMADVQLIWASKVVGVPVCIRVAKFAGLAGLVVTLDEVGSLVVSCILLVAHRLYFHDTIYIWGQTRHTVS